MINKTGAWRASLPLMLKIAVRHPTGYERKKETHDTAKLVKKHLLYLALTSVKLQPGGKQFPNFS